MIFFVLIILALGCISEFISTYLVVFNYISMGLITHFIACIVIVFACQLYLKNSFKGNNLYFYLFLILICFFIPVFGGILSLFMVFHLNRLRRTFHKHAKVMETTINLEDMIPFYAKYGSGGVTRQILKTDAIVTKRTEALFMLNQTPLSKLNKLFYDLLPDQSDEMRLLAFNILEGQEDTINKKINELSLLLESEIISPKARAKFEKDLVNQYWELIYNHLISPDLENDILEKAISHALSAVKILVSDAALWVLLGKMYKYSKQYTLAEEAFHKAIDLKISKANVLPYLAEIKFITHDYLGVQHYLNSSEIFQDIPQIAPVKDFWSTK